MRPALQPWPKKREPRWREDEAMETIDQETDSLGSLEERILQAVQLVGRLRQEKEALSERDTALKAAALAQQQVSELKAELDVLKAEKRQVRSRIEKLLGQIDQLSGA
jgi:FtsZ-binding cell division protein ZapB